MNKLESFTFNRDAAIKHLQGKVVRLRSQLMNTQNTLRAVTKGCAHEWLSDKGYHVCQNCGAARELLENQLA